MTTISSGLDFHRGLSEQSLLPGPQGGLRALINIGIGDEVTRLYGLHGGMSCLIAGAGLPEGTVAKFVALPFSFLLTGTPICAILNLMVNYSSSALDATFGALADPTRRAILARLGRGESSIVELAAPFRVSLPAVLKHVRVLEGAGLLTRRKDGRVNHCRLRAAPMKRAAAWIEEYKEFWEEQFDVLARFLEESQKEENTTWQHQPRVRKPRFNSGGRSQRRARKSSQRGPSAKR